jgi:hypothetical protein
VDLIPKIAHFVILTPTGNYRFLKFKSVKNNPFWAIYACGVEARPRETRPPSSKSVLTESGLDEFGCTIDYPTRTLFDKS